MITGEHIYLRALEPGDLDFLYALENSTELWEYSATQTPYSRYVLQQYLDNALRDIYEVKQLRLVIVKTGGEAVGLIDLFDFDPKNKRAGIGVVIAEERHRNSGYAAEALRLLCDYAFIYLDLHQLYANIGEKNTKSIALFEKQGFQNIGVKKDWNYNNGVFSNELMYQLIKK